MKVCRACGAEFSDEATVCTQCEGKLYDEASIEIKYSMPGSAITFYVLAFGSMCFGFYKMLIYNSGEYAWEEPMNVYVGGDAYNYIINSNYAVAYFVLALCLVLIGSTLAILKALNMTR